MSKAPNDPAVLGPVQRQVRPGAEARPLVERLRSRDWADRHHRKYREEAANEIERLRAALLACARQAESLKRECGMDPESAQAVRNAQYQAISTMAHIALGTVRGPASA